MAGNIIAEAHTCTTLISRRLCCHFFKLLGKWGVGEGEGKWLEQREK